jgi:hypothetical protein
MMREEFQKGIAKIIKRFNLADLEEIPDNVKQQVEREVEQLYRKAARDVHKNAKRSLEQNFKLDRVL